MGRRDRNRYRRLGDRIYVVTVKTLADVERFQRGQARRRARSAAIAARQHALISAPAADEDSLAEPSDHVAAASLQAEPRPPTSPRGPPGAPGFRARAVASAPS